MHATHICYIAHVLSKELRTSNPAVECVYNTRCREGCCGSSLHQSQVGRGKRLRDISNKGGTEIFRYTLDVPGVLLLLLLLVLLVLFQLVLVVLLFACYYPLAATAAVFSPTTTLLAQTGPCDALGPLSYNFV